jgi:hypothetical protein
MTDRKEYMREYMSRRRASKQRRTASEATEPVNTTPEPKRVNNAHSWADSQSLWIHPDGRVRNFPPGELSVSESETSAEAALPKDVLDWRNR